MSNPITAVLAVTTAASEAVVVGIEGAAAFASLWRSKQQVEHKLDLKVFELETLVSYGKRTEKAQAALSDLPPSVIAYLQGND